LVRSSRWRCVGIWATPCRIAMSRSCSPSAVSRLITSVSRWVQRFTAEFLDAARPARHALGNRWFLDETYVKVDGRWIYLYRAVDQHGHVIDVLVSRRRDAVAARAFFARALPLGPAPVELTRPKEQRRRRGLD